MSIAGSPSPTALVDAARPLRRRVHLYLELAKARLSAMVVFSTAVGFVMATDGAVQWAPLLWTALGTAMAAASAAAFNQVIEVERDRRMRRTAGRPIVSGAMSVRHALLVAIVLGASGVALLALLAHPLAAGLALLTIILYVGLYTPLKPRTTLNTLVGAVCGALPPMIGWAAASGTIDHPGAWLLAALLFVWQLPHFMALAWLYRDDYARGGFAMLPNHDASGELTSRVVCLTSVLLLMIAAAFFFSGLAGWVFALGAIAGGSWALRRAVRFYLDRSDRSARRVFHASLLYLALVLALLLIDSGPAPLASGRIASAAGVAAAADAP